MTEKIRQSVLFGSVFLALESNSFSARALLSWLNSKKLNDKTQIAYKAICHYISPNEHYVDDGYHFLIKNIEYTYIALKYGLLPEILISTDKNCPTSLRFYIHNEINSYIKNPIDHLFEELILTGKGFSKFIEANINSCYLSRNIPYIDYLSADVINTNLVESDWIDKFYYNKNLSHLIIDRMLTLKEIAPIYYSEIAYPVYSQVAIKLRENRLLTQDTLLMLSDIFPEMIDSKMLEYDSPEY